MLLSLSLIMLSGLLLGWVCRKVHFPSLFGMIIAGIIIGPHVLNLIDPQILQISADIRRIALIIILIRAGLKLKVSDLQKAGRPAILMCFLPACFEIAGMVLLAPKLLGITALEAAVMGAVVGAVSPAVIVPRMIRLIDEGYGTEKGIPQMILAGASVDDVFVIVLFSAFVSLAKGGTVSVISVINIPVSIVIGIITGTIIGIGLCSWFAKMHIDHSVQVIILLAIAFFLSYVEDAFAWLPFASLIAIMCIGMPFRNNDEAAASALSGTFDQLWKCAEIFLFVLVGASVSIESAWTAGAEVIVLLAGVLVFRILGVTLCLLGTGFTIKEKLFSMIAYTPKATVQAAIGGIPLAMGLACGQIVLTVSVIAILLTAPLGALGIDLTYQRFLERDAALQ